MAKRFIKLTIASNMISTFCVTDENKPDEKSETVMIGSAVAVSNESHILSQFGESTDMKQQAEAVCKAVNALEFRVEEAKETDDKTASFTQCVNGRVEDAALYIKHSITRKEESAKQELELAKAALHNDEGGQQGAVVEGNTVENLMDAMSRTNQHPDGTMLQDGKDNADEYHRTIDDLFAGSITDALKGKVPMDPLEMLHASVHLGNGTPEAERAKRLLLAIITDRSTSSQENIRQWNINTVRTSLENKHGAEKCAVFVRKGNDMRRLNPLWKHYIPFIKNCDMPLPPPVTSSDSLNAVFEALLNAYANADWNSVTGAGDATKVVQGDMGKLLQPKSKFNIAQPRKTIKRQKIKLNIDALQGAGWIDCFEENGKLKADTAPIEDAFRQQAYELQQAREMIKGLDNNVEYLLRTVASFEKILREKNVGYPDRLQASKFNKHRLNNKPRSKVSKKRVKGRGDDVVLEITDSDSDNSQGFH